MEKYVLEQREALESIVVVCMHTSIQLQEAKEVVCLVKNMKSSWKTQRVNGRRQISVQQM